MTHNRERKEIDCLNCGAVVYGRFCHLCGQENTEPKQTFWHLVTHFVYDVTHFDGKFFSTVKYLLLRPGFLPRQFIIGRRTNYLNPIRMYVFTSAIFFIFFFSVFKPEEQETPKTYKEVKAALLETNEGLTVALKRTDVPASVKQGIQKKLLENNEDLEYLKHDTTNLEKLNYYHKRSLNVFYNGSGITKEQYDSIQKKTNNKDSWLSHKVMNKKFEIDSKYGSDTRKFLNDLFEKFFHRFPQILFISLPLFALLLQLLYARHKDLYYADHVIYAVHLYCATFISIFLIMALNKLELLPWLKWVSYLNDALAIYMCWYNYKALKNFYYQSRKKTILKLCLLLIMSLTVMSLLFLGFFIFSIFTL